MTPSRLALALALALPLVACGDAEDEAEPAPPNPFAEVIEAGAGRFLGQIRPTSQEETSPGVVTYEFDVNDGPACLDGEPYRFSLRDRGTDDLFLFLQGGGACWSDFCLAVTAAPAGIPPLDVLDPESATNPLRDTTTVYLPYCDGSLFAGHAEHDDDGDGTRDRLHRGLANLTAVLDQTRREVPAPKRVILAGSSGGGYGTILATLMVRTLWPRAELLVFDDAGPGLGRPGDPALIDQLLTEFGVDGWWPASCVGCTDEGHITPLVAWGMERDPNLKVSLFSSYDDYVISNIFLGLEPGQFRTALVEQTGRVHAAYPDRFKRFLINGAIHTTLLGGVDGIIGSDLTKVILPPGIAGELANIDIGGMDTSVVRGVTVSQWFQAMLDGTEAWDDRLDAP